MERLAEKYRGKENKRLILIIERKGYTYATLAAASGVHERTIYDIARGKFLPRLDTLMDICQVLQVSIDEIYPIEL